jgi:hypothetical protein
MRFSHGLPVFSIALALAAAAAPTPPAHAQDMDACIAASEVATTARRAGRLLDARAALSTCASSSCPDAVKSSCQQRLVEIRRAVPSIAFQVKDAAGNDLSNVRVTVDGKPQDGGVTTALELDPGAHAFTFEAAGQSTIHQSFTLVEGARERHESITMGTPPPAASPPKPTLPAEGAAGPHGSGDVSGGSKGSPPWRTVGWVAGAVGVAGLGLGAGFGLVTMSKKSAGECDSSGVCQDYASIADAKHTAAVATAGFVAGGVLIASGAALLLLTPGPRAAASARSGARGAAVRATPMVGPAGGGMSLEGTW